MVVAGPGLARADAAETLRALAGIAYRPALASWIDTRPATIQCLEIIAEQFYKGGETLARSLSSRHPIVVHTSRLSLGTPGALDRRELDWFVSLVREVKPLWVSEHLGFRRTAEVDLGYPTPIPLDANTLSVFVDHCREVMDRCGKLLLVENIASPLTITSALSEPEFLNRLCDASGCGLLVDLTALVVNSRQHRFAAGSWLARIVPTHVVQLHVGGAALRNGVWLDTHGEDVDAEVWALAADLLARAPIRAIVLERDERFPPASDLAAELRRVSSLVRGRLIESFAPGRRDP